MDIDNRTKRQIRDSLILQLSGMELSDDSLLDELFIEDQMDNIREVLINQAFEAKKLDDAFYQESDCYEIQCKPASECMVDGITFTSEIDMNYADLPNLITGLKGKEIRYLGSAGFTCNFTRRTLNSFMHNNGNTWTAGNPIYTKIGNRVFFKNLPTFGTKLLTFVGLLLKPEELCNYNSDTYYPVPSVHKLELLVIKHIVSGGLSIPRDIMNDAMSDQMQRKPVSNERTK